MLPAPTLFPQRARASPWLFLLAAAAVASLIPITVEGCITAGAGLPWLRQCEAAELERSASPPAIAPKGADHH